MTTSATSSIRTELPSLELLTEARLKPLLAKWQKMKTPEKLWRARNIFLGAANTLIKMRPTQPHPVFITTFLSSTGDNFDPPCTVNTFHHLGFGSSIDKVGVLEKQRLIWEGLEDK